MKTTTYDGDAIKKDDDFLCGLEFHDLPIKVYLTYIGLDKVQYTFFWKGNLLFSGKDYKPAALYNYDSLECIAGLLAFLCLQSGGVAADYFKDYTPAQIEWRDSTDCETLSYTITDFEDDSNEGFAQAKEYLSSIFIQP